VDLQAVGLAMGQFAGGIGDCCPFGRNLGFGAGARHIGYQG
jgi:hypothetical protein